MNKNKESEMKYEYLDAYALTYTVCETLKAWHGYELSKDVKEHLYRYFNREPMDMGNSEAVFVADELFETAKTIGLDQKLTPKHFWAQDYMAMFCLENEFDPYEDSTSLPMSTNPEEEFEYRKAS